MLYTIIDIYEVMRTDEIYPAWEDYSGGEKQSCICTNPYEYLKECGG